MQGPRSVGVALVASALVAGVEPPPAGAQFVTAPDGVRIAYETRGEGPTALVFVHGWSCDRSYWRAQLASFARRYRVVAVDLAGHGESGLGRASYTIGAFGDDVAAVVRALGLRRVVLIGHSMGGSAIAEAARRLPGRVAGLVLVETTKQLGAGQSPEAVAAFVARFRPAFPDTARAFVRSMFVSSSDRGLVERVVADMSSAPPAVAIPTLQAARAYSRELPRTLESLRLPVVAINADNARTDTASLRRYGVDVLVMPHVGHFLMLEDPPRFDGLLATAIERILAR